MKKFSQDIIITIIAGVTSLLTAVILVILEQTLNFSFYSYMLWFVIPIGAIGSGFVAASGYYLGAKWFNHKPSRLILLNMLAISTITFFLIYWLNYISLTYNGKPVSDYISYLQYLNLSLANYSMSVCFHYVNCSGGIQLGSFGYIVGALQILGFFAGGASIYGYLSSEIYCNNCSRYYSSKKSQSRYFNIMEEGAKSYDDTLALLIQKKYKDAIDSHANSGEQKVKKDSIIYTILTLKYCKKCRDHFIKLQIFAKRNSKWKEIPKTAKYTYAKEELNLVV